MSFFISTKYKLYKRIRRCHFTVDSLEGNHACAAVSFRKAGMKMISMGRARTHRGMRVSPLHHETSNTEIVF